MIVVKDSEYWIKRMLLADFALKRMFSVLLVNVSTENEFQ